MKSNFAVFLIVVFFAITVNAEELSYPGGSPFPPGQEPIEIAEISVFWTTLDPITKTEVVIQNGQDLPCQECIIYYDEKGEKTDEFRSIAPDSDKRIIFVREESDDRNREYFYYIQKGYGTYSLKVFRNKGDLGTNYPDIIVNYYNGDKLVSKTEYIFTPQR